MILQEFTDIDDKTKYQLQICKFRIAFLILEGAEGQFEKNLGALSSNIYKLFMVTKKMSEKRNTLGKKIPLFTKRSE